MPSGLHAGLSELYDAESAKVRDAFENTRDGLRAIHARSQLVDRIVLELYRGTLSEKLNSEQGFCLVAVGGYGRQELFPHSDIDLLFLSETTHPENHSDPVLREAIAAMTRTLWDLRLRVGHSTRTLADCGRLHRDNLEFSISLLDSRYLAGDERVFARLHAKVVPQLMARDRQDLVGDLVEMTQRRHQKHGDTIFHLEPNLKEAPGGLRDYHVCRWLALIAELDRAGRWSKPEEQWPLPLQTAVGRAFEFLAAVRCFLHYVRERDDNALTYELQDDASSLGVGLRSAQAGDAAGGEHPAASTDPPNQSLAAKPADGGGQALAAAAWMRAYFRHARAIDRLTAQLLNDVTPAHSSLYGLFQDWRSRLSNADFSVMRGRIFPRRPASAFEDASALLALVEMMARHGLELSREAEHWAEEMVRKLATSELGLHSSGQRRAEVSSAEPSSHGSAPSLLPGAPPEFWSSLWRTMRTMLVLPHAPEALRAMHRLGILVALFPEFRAIDALVVRDFYHRYTVDEHSFMTIQNLHELRNFGNGSAAGVRSTAGATRADTEGGDSGTSSSLSSEVWGHKFFHVFSELEQPELLFFSLLFHDVGKGMPGSSHVTTGLEAVKRIMARLGVAPEDRAMVRFLIANHLEMSRTLQRRDIFDLDAVRAFAEKVSTTERLKMLCLFTYADIKAVNPEALTPWKAEMLWQLYASTSNYLTRSLDEERVRAAGPVAQAGTLPSWTEKLEQAAAILATAESGDTHGRGAPSVSESRLELTHRLERFLEGFPKRYLESHSGEEIAGHFRMASGLEARAVQLSLQGQGNLFELTVMTHDRPFLFASLTGTLAAWGMNILKAEAFGNAVGLVLDTFRFVDLYQTLELNPSEGARFEQSVVEVLTGETSLASVIGRRASNRKRTRPKVEIPVQITFDGVSSSHSTLLELITHDRPGLLHRVSSIIAEHGCNIEVALIDTEGEKVVDVFYLTSGGAKLDSPEQQKLREALATGIAGME